MDRYQNDGRRLSHKVDETDFPAEGTEGEGAGCSHSALSRYLITCIAHQHQKSRMSVNLSTLLYCCIAWLLMFSLESLLL